MISNNSVDPDESVQLSFKLRYSKCCSGHRMLKRLAKALIRLRVCAGWSEPLLVALSTLLELAMYEVKMHAGAISKLLYGFTCLRAIIHELYSSSWIIFPYRCTKHFVGPDLGPNCLERLLADDKSYCKQGKS